MAIGTAIVTALSAAYSASEAHQGRKEVRGQTERAEAGAAADIKQVKDEKKSARWRAAMLADRNRKASATAGRRGTFATSPAGIQPAKTLLGGA